MIEEVKHAYEVGVYPIDLFLLEHTSITLTEIDQMDRRRKMEYYYFIIARETYEKALMRGKMGVGSSNQVNIPTVLPESVTTKINRKIELEDLIKEKKEKRLIK